MFANYDVAWTASIPVSDGDIFYLTLPTTVKTPKEPVCIAKQCLTSVTCTSERGRIVATLSVDSRGGCTNSNGWAENTKLMFEVQGIENAPSMVPSTRIDAHWMSRDYSMVAEYGGGDIVITNERPGHLAAAGIKLE